MKQGKRYLRNTVLAIYGTAMAFVALNRLHASVDADTPQWVRNTLTLGLRAAPEPDPRMEFAATDLATLRDFAELSVSGDFAVEIVGATEYKVTFTPAADKPGEVRVNLQGNTLRVVGSETRGATGTATLRVEVPTLETIRVRGLPLLTISGLRAEKLSLSASEVPQVRLQQNQVPDWELRAYGSTDLQVDETTFAAGSLQLTGQIVLRRGN